MRWLKYALVSILVGHVTTWLVAWCCAIAVAHPSIDEGGTSLGLGVDSLDSPQWNISHWSGFGTIQVHSYPWDANDEASSIFLDVIRTDSYEVDLGWSRVEQRRTTPGDPPVVEDARGWPFLALRCTHELAQFQDPGKAITRWGIQLPPNRHPGFFTWLSPRALPFAPLWGGLAADTAIYAGVAFVLIAVCPRPRRAS